MLKLEVRQTTIFVADDLEAYRCLFMTYWKIKVTR